MQHLQHKKAVERGELKFLLQDELRRYQDKV
jgi:hypothetical protein